MLRLYLSGLASMFLVRKIGIKKDTALLAVGIFYAFNVAILFSALRHPMFINGPMYFAFIIYGYEKIKIDNSPFVLIIGTYLALISQFYIFIYITFGFVLFIIIDNFNKFKNLEFKVFIKTNLYYLLGVMLGGFVLVTQLLATYNGARIGSRGFELYDFLDHGVIALSYFLPLAGNHYTAGIGSLIVFMIVMYFIINEKKKSTYSVFFLILFILSFSTIFSFIINIGSYVTNRWMFLLTLPASVIVGKYLETNDRVDERSLVKANKLFYYFLVFGAGLLSSYLVTLLKLRSSLSLIINLIIIFVAICLTFKVYKSKKDFSLFKKILSSSNLYKYVIYNALITLLIVSGIYTFILTPKDSMNLYYGDSDKYFEVFDNDGFYRVEQESYVGGVDAFSNDGIYYNYPSTSSYNSMTDGSIIDLVNEYNIINHNNSVGYNGFNLRTRLLAINHVKYVIIRESTPSLPPYGFSLYKTIMVEKYDDSLGVYNRGGNFSYDKNGNLEYEKAYIYRNNLDLNFGVVYDTYLTKKDIGNLNAIEKELLLTKTIVLDNEFEEVDKYDKSLDYNKFYIEDYRSMDIKIDNSKDNINRINSISFKIPRVKNSEVFIEIENIESIDPKLSFETTYSTNDVTKVVRNYGYASNMYIENKIHLVNLGYYEDEVDLEITISFGEGIFKIRDVGYYLVETNDLEDDINLLNANSLTKLEFGNSSFKGNINTSKNGYLFISLPYSNGFRAYIDGVEVDILKANTGYMAVFVEASDKVLEFKYFTPGLEIGLYISVIGLVIFILVARRTFIKNTRMNYQMNTNEDKNETNRKFYQ